jgi:hypothetical protein|nr:MAG TPA: hypothetical protein [Caudoviricetes sp.]
MNPFLVRKTELHEVMLLVKRLNQAQKPKKPTVQRIYAPDDMIL